MQGFTVNTHISIDEFCIIFQRESVNVHEKLLLVINEIIETERTYIKRLRLLTTVKDSNLTITLESIFTFNQLSLG